MLAGPGDVCDCLADIVTVWRIWGVNATAEIPRHRRSRISWTSAARHFGLRGLVQAAHGRIVSLCLDIERPLFTSKKGLLSPSMRGQRPIRSSATIGGWAASRSGEKQVNARRSNWHTNRSVGVRRYCLHQPSRGDDLCAVPTTVVACPTWRLGCVRAGLASHSKRETSKTNRR
jgi:hypothetical protein